MSVYKRRNYEFESKLAARRDVLCPSPQAVDITLYSMHLVFPDRQSAVRFIQRAIRAEEKR